MSGPARSRTLATVLVAGGAVLALAAFSRPWVVVTSATPGLPSTTLEVSGADLQTGAAALPLVLLAGLLAVWASAGWLRRAVGVLVAVVGGALVVAAARVGLGPLDAATVPQATGLGGAPGFATTPWWWLAAAGGLAAAVGGVLVAVRGPSWSAMSGRYQRGAAPAPASAERGDRAAWDLLDAGVDPTAEPGASEPADAVGPPDGEAGSGTMTGRTGPSQEPR